MSGDDQNKNSNPDAEGRKGATLNMENIAINTMGEDLNKSGIKEDDKTGWLNFIAKHKKNSGSAPAGSGLPEAKKSVPTEEASHSVLDKEIDQFKSESGEGAGPAEPPLNLPVAGAEKENKTAKKDSADLDPGKQLMDSLVDKSNQKIPMQETDQALPSLKFEEERSDREKKTATLIKNGVAAKTPFKPATLKDQLSGVLEGRKIDPERLEADPRGKPALVIKDEGAFKVADTETAIKKEEEEQNPFSAKLQTKPLENKSLLSSVESALNYSASPEFAAKREETTDGQEENKVVDLRSGQNQPRQPFFQEILQNKKLLIIIGGGVGGLIVLIIILAAVFSGSGKTNKPQTVVSNQNGNENQNPVTPIKPVVAPPVTQPVEVLDSKEFLPTTHNVTIESIADLSDQIDRFRQGQAVAKQTQLVLLKSDGSAVSFEDLIEAEEIIIPSRILAEPNREQALLFADFFKGKTVLGLVIPVKSSESQIISDLKVWETTMTSDLKFLWKGIQIDNPNAYFADSQLFTGGRFALIDKAQGLSLDYLVEKGYIFITCGKDSMTILKDQFIPPAADPGSSGIKESSTAVSGINSNSNALNQTEQGNVASEANENLNSQ
ncbi:MAG: hypothetical protein FJZ04_01895 [Candidatus Moranbacteria bacterium]|nr:hypothetical protein [Candidatus Moranbacteria bacterium]